MPQTTKRHRCDPAGGVSLFCDSMERPALTMERREEPQDSTAGEEEPQGWVRYEWGGQTCNSLKKGRRIRGSEQSKKL